MLDFDLSDRCEDTNIETASNYLRQFINHPQPWITVIRETDDTVTGVKIVASKAYHPNSIKRARRILTAVGFTETTGKDLVHFHTDYPFVLCPSENQK